jgi:hypothetical protein
MAQKKAETKAEAKETKNLELGAVVSGDGNFTVEVKENEVIAISPRPWEGPAAFVTRRERLAELIDTLEKLK